MPSNQNTPNPDTKKQDQENNKQHHQDKPHHQGTKEMPTSLPNQKISSDGKKIALTDAEKEAASE